MEDARDAVPQHTHGWAPKVSALWTFAGLAAGVVLGIVLQGAAGLAPWLATASAIGDLWLNGLQVTIVPLVAALLVTGIQQIAAAAQGGRAARATLGMFVALLFVGGTAAVLLTPVLLEMFPIPTAAVSALGGAPGGISDGALTTRSDYHESLVPTYIVAAAA